MPGKTGGLVDRKDTACFFGLNGRTCCLLRHSLIFICMGVALFLWGGDAWYHAFVLHESGFWGNVFDFTSHETYMRLVTAIPVVFIGVIGELAFRNEERKIRAISRAHSEMRQIFDGAGEGMVLIDSSFKIQKINHRACDLFEIKAEEALGNPCHEILPSNFCHSKSCPIQRIISGESCLQSEVDKLRSDGTRIVCLITASAFYDAEGRFLGVIESCADITARKEMEEELRRHRDRLDVLIRERTAELEKTNRAYKLEIAERCRIQAKLEEHRARLQKTNQELKEHQAQLIQSEKMASIGQLAAGVAHEINNPIGFIRSNLHTLAEYQADLKKLAAICYELKAAASRCSVEVGDMELMRALKKLTKYADKIDPDFVLGDMAEAISQCIEGVDHIKKIVADLKEFSHVDQADFKYADINQSLKSTINMAWNKIKHRAELETDFGDIPLIRCYPQQINQVFLNLLINAAQAMDDKGTIRVSTHRAEENGVPQVVVEISDTGRGIPPDVLPKIFDPFFTTKDVGEGTGLGLNIAYKIVERHGGRIDVKSEVGKGTTFIIRLPVT